MVALCENGDEAGRSADTFTFSYEDDLSIAEKIEAIAKRVYHADGVVFEPAAQKEIAQLEALGFGRHARVHGQDPVLVLGRRHQAGRSPRFHRSRCAR